MASAQRVLVVDDDPTVRESVRDALAPDGVECELAASGAEALKALEDPRVACVVLDVRVREPDAITLLPLLREQRPGLRVIALASQADQELVLRALRGGACDYLAKPIHTEELQLAVGRALEVAALQSAWEADRDRIAELEADRDRIAELEADRDRIAELEADRDRSAELEVDRDRIAQLEADRERLLELEALTGELERAVSQAEAERDAARAEAGQSAATARAAPEASTPQAAPPDADAELLREICDGMTREIEPERLLTAALRPLARATDARVVSLLLIDNREGRLACEAQCAGSDAERAHLPRDAGLTGACLHSGTPVATDRPERDPRFDPAVDTPESGATGPLLIVPLKVRGRVLGVARVFPAAERGAPARLAELIAAPLSAATRNVLLYRSLLESVEDVARARREAETKRSR